MFYFNSLSKIIIIHQVYPVNTALYSYENQKILFNAFAESEIFLKSLCWKNAQYDEWHNLLVFIQTTLSVK